MKSIQQAIFNKDALTLDEAKRIIECLYETVCYIGAETRIESDIKSNDSKMDDIALHLEQQEAQAQRILKRLL